MEEFDYSVQICDQDWDSFFQDCEECRLLSPSLAGLEESGMSGMSDMDDMGSLRTANDMKVHVPVGLLQGECSIDDGPPHCEGSPVEHRLCKYGVGGMENVLSGSEEDLHLQSVNTFFEGLRFLTEAERLIEPSQIGVGKNPEPVQEEEMWRDGPQASMGTMPKSYIPELNSVAVNSETTTSKETTDLINTKSNENVMKKDFKIVCFAASNSQIEVHKSTNPERELFIREADRSMTTATEVRKQTPSHESPDEAVRSGKSPDCDELLSSDMNISKWVNDVRQGDVLSDETALNKNLSVESPTPLEVMSKCKLEKGRDVTLPSPDADPKNLNCGVSQACSPSPSTKKKRRKKKRVSFGPVETGHGYTRPFIANESDSEYESCIWGRGMDPHFSGNNSVAHWNKTEKNVETSITVLPTHWQAFQRATTHNLSLSPMENKAHILSSSTPLRDWQYQNLSEMFDLSECPVLKSKLTDAGCKATDLPGNITSTDRTATPQGQTGDDVNLPTNVQSCSILHLKGSTELNKAHWLPVSNSIGVTSTLELDTEMAACDRESLSICEEGEATHGVSLQQSNEMNSSNTAQDTLVTQSSVSQSQGSNNPALKSGQSHKESTSESDLPVEVANSGKDSTGESEAEPPQHLAMNCHDKAQCSCTSEKTNVPVCTVVINGSDPQHLSAQETMHKQLKNRLHATHSENPPEVSGANLTPDSNVMLSPDSISCYLDENNKTQETKYSPAVKSSTEPDHFPEITVSSIPHEINGQNDGYLQSGELNNSSTINNQRQNNSISSTSDNLLTSRSNITPNGSLEGRQNFSLVLNKEPIMKLLDESVTSMSNNTGSSVCPNNISGYGERIPQITVKNEVNEVSDLQDTSKQKCHSESMAEDAVTTENDIENAPDSKHSVFAISSFWNEMEKLTINDILGLRMASNAPPDSSLPLLPESMDSDNSDGADSGYFTQLDGSKPDQTSGDMSSSNVIESNSDPVKASSNSMAVMWVREPDPVSLGEGIYPENMMPRSVSDTLVPLLSSSGIEQKYPKKMPKNISVHNLPALESEPCVSAWRGQTLSPIISEDGEVEIDYFERMPPPDSVTESLPPSPFTEHVSAQSNGISLTNIFHYFFGEKQSKPIPSDTYSLPPCYIGDSVPETYDHFFSEFDTGSFCSPLTVATAQSKDELVPIFSTNRNLQFPEGYDYFFPSSSSDEDEDDNEVRRPIQVVTRLSQKANEAPISSDIYENFFTDGDQHNFFWKNTFSLRNICFTSSVSQNQRTNSLTVVPVKQTSGSVRRAIHPIGMLGNHDAPFPDPLYHIEDRIIRQLAEQPHFKYGDLQMAVANPRLDASFLPLRQSDMCLVCIAFASWVLKSANPQVGDAWKAVLLANISALSAIRYLRKYVRKEASGEKASSHND